VPSAAKEIDQALICEKLDFVKKKQSEVEQELDQRLDGIQNELSRQASILEELNEEIKRVLSIM
jgi:chaperonin cofactor prefoldin